ncbi:undecaprenyldiphospho-muramoylpentapeptide beta-N-acetylglucosaminyltransferase [bacterium]|nr:undecaprenyldiphospho-muramoylpentapeptide beta-N-acetylglucosaminyltransferase [bacterium]|tara:strand:- start:32990 stop:34129 length:1140 start_codon:yes stop_codon:yes gene_type:complete
MRIVFTGGGTGGHFYPIISVAEEIHEIVEKEKLIPPELYYIGPNVLDYEALVEQNIVWKQSSAGKVRRYFAIQNFFDLFKIVIGTIQATVQMYFLYPDVVFSKGGYASFPTTFAARLLNIPVIIHESDAHPGRANVIAAKWARAVAISFPGVAKYFEGIGASKLALVGNPIRRALFRPAREGAHTYLNLKKGEPTILILGGSQGAQAINSVVLDALPELLEKYQVIHQAGKSNVEQVRKIANVILKDNPNKDRYRVFGFLNILAMRMSAGIASVIIARAGAGTIFEIAAWGLPAIMIPLPEEISHDQTKNAFAYARGGAAIVLKQKNLTKNILLAELDRIMSDPEIQSQMTEAAHAFARPDASKKIARMLLKTALEHEQ